MDGGFIRKNYVALALIALVLLSAIPYIAFVEQDDATHGWDQSWHLFLDQLAIAQRFGELTE